MTFKMFTALLLFSFANALVADDAKQARDHDASLPNIVLIMADDLGYGELGCYGQQKIHTPRIDQLAAEGMRFTQAYSGANVCQPSRCSLMTGLHTGHTTVRTNGTDLMLNRKDSTFVAELRQRGYATGGFGKWGLGFEGTTGHPLEQGFDTWYGQLLQGHAHFHYPYWLWRDQQKVLLTGNEEGKRQQYVDDELRDAAIEFIREHHNERFFAYVPFILPHVELVVPDIDEAPYRDRFPPRTLQDSRKGYISSTHGLATFAGMVSHLDQNVGRIVDCLDQLGVSENTLVIFVSDNGGQGGGLDNAWKIMTDFFAGNGPLRGYKGQFYEGGIRVPMIARWPGTIASGVTTDQPIAFWDFAPTLLKLTGGPGRQRTDGLSFLPTLLGEQQSRQRKLYWEMPRGNTSQRAARWGNWKLIQNPIHSPPKLYDLSADIEEQNDVAADHHDLVEKITAWMDSQHEAPPAFPAQNVQHSAQKYVR